MTTGRINQVATLVASDPAPSPRRTTRRTPPTTARIRKMRHLGNSELKSMLHDSCVSHQKTVEELTLSICPGSRERDPDNTTQKGVSFFLSVARAPHRASYDAQSDPQTLPPRPFRMFPRAEPPKPTFGHSVWRTPEPKLLGSNRTHGRRVGGGRPSVRTGQNRRSYSRPDGCRPRRGFPNYVNRIA